MDEIYTDLCTTFFAVGIKEDGHSVYLTAYASKKGPDPSVRPTYAIILYEDLQRSPNITRHLF